MATGLSADVVLKVKLEDTALKGLEQKIDDLAKQLQGSSKSGPAAAATKGTAPAGAVSTTKIDTTSLDKALRRLEGELSKNTQELAKDNADQGGKGSGGKKGGGGVGGGRGGGGSPGFLGGVTQGFGKTLATVTQFGLASKLIQAPFAAFGEGLRTIREVDKEIAELNKVLATTGSTLDKLKSSAVSVGKEFGSSVDEVLRGFKVFAQQGLDPAQVAERGRVVALASNVSTLDTNDAAETITAGLKVFGKSLGGSAERIIDSFVAVESQNAVTAGDLAEVSKRIGAAAENAGVSFDQLNALTTVIQESTRAGGARISRALRFTLKNLRDPVRRDKIENLGVNVLGPTGDLRSSFDVLKDISKIFPTLTKRQQQQAAVTIAGTRFTAEFISLMNNFSKVGKVVGQSQNSQGTAFERNAIIMETLDKQFAKTQASFQGFVLSFSDGLVAPLTTALKLSQSVLDTLAEIGNQEINLPVLGGLGEGTTIGGAAGSVAGAAGLGLGAAVLTKSVLGPVMKGLFLGAGSGGGVAGFMGKLAIGVRGLLGPIGLLTAAFTLLAPVLQRMFESSEQTAKRLGVTDRRAIASKTAEDIGSLGHETQVLQNLFQDLNKKGLSGQIAEQEKRKARGELGSTETDLNKRVQQLASDIQKTVVDRGLFGGNVPGLSLEESTNDLIFKGEKLGDLDPNATVGEALAELEKLKEVQSVIESMSKFTSAVEGAKKALLDFGARAENASGASSKTALALGTLKKVAADANDLRGFSPRDIREGLAKGFQNVEVDIENTETGEVTAKNFKIPLGVMQDAVRKSGRTPDKETNIRGEITPTNRQRRRMQGVADFIESRLGGAFKVVRTEAELLPTHSDFKSGAGPGVKQTTPVLSPRTFRFGEIEDGLNDSILKGIQEGVIKGGDSFEQNRQDLLRSLPPDQVQMFRGNRGEREIDRALDPLMAPFRQQLSSALASGQANPAGMLASQLTSFSDSMLDSEGTGITAPKSVRTLFENLDSMLAKFAFDGSKEAADALRSVDVGSKIKVLVNEIQEDLIGNFQESAKDGDIVTFKGQAETDLSDSRELRDAFSSIESGQKILAKFGDGFQVEGRVTEDSTGDKFASLLIPGVEGAITAGFTQGNFSKNIQEALAKRQETFNQRAKAFSNLANAAERKALGFGGDQTPEGRKLLKEAADFDDKAQEALDQSKAIKKSADAMEGLGQASEISTVKLKQQARITELLGGKTIDAGFGAGQAFQSAGFKRGADSLLDLPDQIAGALINPRLDLGSTQAAQFDRGLSQFLVEAANQQKDLQQEIKEVVGRDSEKDLDPGKVAEISTKRIRIGALSIVDKVASSLGVLNKAFERAAQRAEDFASKLQIDIDIPLNPDDIRNVFGGSLPKVELPKTSLQELTPEERAGVKLPKEFAELAKTQNNIKAFKGIAFTFKQQERSLNTFLSGLGDDVINSVNTETLEKALSSPGGLDLKAGELKKVVNEIINLNADKQAVTTGDREEKIKQILTIITPKLQALGNAAEENAKKLAEASAPLARQLKTAIAFEKVNAALEKFSNNLSQSRRFDDMFRNIEKAAGNTYDSALGAKAPIVFAGDNRESAQRLDFSNLSDLEMQKRMLQLRTSDEVRSGRRQLFDDSGQRIAPLSDKDASFQRNIIRAEEQNAKRSEREKRSGAELSKIAAEIRNTLKGLDTIKNIGGITKEGEKAIDTAILNLTSLDRRSPSDFVDKRGNIKTGAFTILDEIPKILSKAIKQSVDAGTLDLSKQRESVIKNLRDQGAISGKEADAALQKQKEKEFQPVVEAVGVVSKSIEAMSAVIQSPLDDLVGINQNGFSEMISCLTQIKEFFGIKETPMTKDPNQTTPFVRGPAANNKNQAPPKPTFASVLAGLLGKGGGGSLPNYPGGRNYPSAPPGSLAGGPPSSLPPVQTAPAAGTSTPPTSGAGQPAKAGKKSNTPLLTHRGDANKKDAPLTREQIRSMLGLKGKPLEGKALQDARAKAAAAFKAANRGKAAQDSDSNKLPERLNLTKQNQDKIRKERQMELFNKNLKSFRAAKEGSRLGEFITKTGEDEATFKRKGREQKMSLEQAARRLSNISIDPDRMGPRTSTIFDPSGSGKDDTGRKVGLTDTIRIDPKSGRGVSIVGQGDKPSRTAGKKLDPNNIFDTSLEDALEVNVGRGNGQSAGRILTDAERKRMQFNQDQKFQTFSLETGKPVDSNATPEPRDSLTRSFIEKGNSFILSQGERRISPDGQTTFGPGVKPEEMQARKEDKKLKNSEEAKDAQMEATETAKQESRARQEARQSNQESGSDSNVDVGKINASFNQLSESAATLSVALGNLSGSADGFGAKLASLNVGGDQQSQGPNTSRGGQDSTTRDAILNLSQVDTTQEVKISQLMERIERCESDLGQVKEVADTANSVADQARVGVEQVTNKTTELEGEVKLTQTQLNQMGSSMVTA